MTYRARWRGGPPRDRTYWRIAYFLLPRSTTCRRRAAARPRSVKAATLTAAVPMDDEHTLKFFMVCQPLSNRPRFKRFRQPHLAEHHRLAGSVPDRGRPRQRLSPGPRYPARQQGSLGLQRHSGWRGHAGRGHDLEHGLDLRSHPRATRKHRRHDHSRAAATHRRARARPCATAAWSHRVWIIPKRIGSGLAALSYRSLRTGWKPPSSGAKRSSTTRTWIRRLLARSEA